jgi:hypothetical protein
MTDIFTKTTLLGKSNLLARTSSYSSGWDIGAVGLGFGLVWIFSYLAFYIYFAITLMFIAKKTGTPNSWMAWIPILNLYLMCKAAGKSGIWIILLLLPVVNVVAMILLWAGIAQRLGRSGLWGLLMLIPVLNLVLMGILAFSKSRQPIAPPLSGAAPSPAPAAPAAPPAAPTAKGRFCPKCGANIISGDKFCPDCGNKI